MNKPVQYLLYAFAVALVLPMSATSIVLGLLVIMLIKDLVQRTVSTGDFKKDSLLYVALFSWKAFTRALATSIKEMHQVKGVWDRVPYAVIGFYRIHREAIIRIMHILFLANAVIVVYALAQHYLGVPALYKPLFYQDTGRMSGSFGHPNQYGGCVSIVLIMNICFALYQDRRFFAYTPFLIAGLVFAGSRSYFLGVFAAFVVLLFLSKSIKRVATYSAAAAIVIAVIMLTVPWFSQRISSIFSPEQNVYRLNIWKFSWGIFLEHPLVGVGSGMLPSHLEPYKEQGLIDFTVHAHNMYIHELAENGIPGFILVIGTQLYFCVKYFKVQSRVAEPVLKALSLGIALSIVNLLVAGMFEHNFGAAIVAMNINFLMGVAEGYRLTKPGEQLLNA
jgi:O-antigen ligase